MGVLDSQTVHRSHNRRMRRKAAAGDRPRENRQVPRRDLKPSLARDNPSGSYRSTSPASVRPLEWLETGLAIAVDGSRRLLKATGGFGRGIAVVLDKGTAGLAWIGIALATGVWTVSVTLVRLMLRLFHLMTPHVRSSVRRSASLGRQGAVSSARIGRTMAGRTKSQIRTQTADMRDGFPDPIEGLVAARRFGLRALAYLRYRARKMWRTEFFGRPGWRQLARTASTGLATGGATMAVAGAALLGPEAVRTNEAFDLVEIDVRGNAVVFTEDILQASELELGSNITTLDLAQVADDIQKLPWVESVHLRRGYPDRLTVTVVERKPTLMLADGQLWFVDAKGEVFKPVEADEWTDLPVVTGMTLDERGVDPDGCKRRLQRALVLVEAFDASRTLDASDIGELRVVDEQHAEVRLADGGVAVHLDIDDARQGLGRLDTLIEQDLVDLDDVVRLDLAMRNQVVATRKADL